MASKTIMTRPPFLTRWLARLLAGLALTLPAAMAADAKSHSVPGDHDSIQAAIDAAAPGDVVVVQPGRYRERLSLRPGVMVRSRGDDRAGKIGLARAEATVIDGGGAGPEPGVRMAPGSELDGFTVTGVGVFDEALWKQHHATQGAELADAEGAIGPDTIPAILVPAVDCRVRHNIVHHNGDVGIAVAGKSEAQPLIADNRCYRNLGGGIGVADGAEPVVRENECYENLRAGIGCRAAGGLILRNRCHHNIRAGIGCREGARPWIRENRCWKNRRAGIGVRLAKTAPLVEGNECWENAMAGIGSRDRAEPILRGNLCRANQLAGIGCDGSRAILIENTCRDNQLAGIGLRGQARVTVRGNVCEGNRLVAIGVTAGSTAWIEGNKLSREGGMPPLVAIRGGSQATLRDNELIGGGVAGVLVEGQAVLEGNVLKAQTPGRGTAVWVWPQSSATLSSNRVEGFAVAVRANKSQLRIVDNQFRGCAGTAITIQEATNPPHVFGNVLISSAVKAQVVEIRSGPSGIVADNEVRPPEDGED